MGAGRTRHTAYVPIRRRSAGRLRLDLLRIASPTAQPRRDPRCVPDPRQALGRLGEQLALEHLERLGYSLVARNHRTRFGELDLIVTDGRALVFAEVKTRRGRHAG